MQSIHMTLFVLRYIYQKIISLLYRHLKGAERHCLTSDSDSMNAFIPGRLRLMPNACMGDNENQMVDSGQQTTSRAYGSLGAGIEEKRTMLIYQSLEHILHGSKASSRGDVEGNMMWRRQEWSVVCTNAAKHFHSLLPTITTGFYSTLSVPLRSTPTTISSTSYAPEPALDLFGS